MDHPHITELEERTHRVFIALMWALSQPGHAFVLPAGGLAAFRAVAEALLDLETGYHTDSAELGPWFGRSGARAQPPATAMYHFYPRLGPDLAMLRDAPVGSYSYPDEAATLVIGCSFGAGRALRLRGPGIASLANLWVDGIPDAFWELREQACRYPLGWDVLLIGNDHVVGLPRTTQIEVE